jgi:hypothetical protein
LDAWVNFSDSFHSQENLAKILEIRGDSDNADESRRFFFIKGSMHQNHIDAPFVG